MLQKTHNYVENLNQGLSMKVLITGGAGFIGHHVVKQLIDSGHDVMIIDNLSRSLRENIEFIKELGVLLKPIDVRDLNSLSDAFKEFRPEAVVHAAALIDVEESVKHPGLYAEVNVTGSANVGKASCGVGASRIIYLSSAAVYGEPKYLPIDENHPTEPLSPYGASKLGGELLIKSLSRSLKKTNYVVLRLFNVYGPGQSPDSPYSGVITKFISRVKSGQPPIIYGDGEQVRDFIHVKDVAKAVEKALTTELLNETYNIGSGKPTTINELANAILKISGKEELKPRHEAPRPGDIRLSYADISKALNQLKWRPETSLEKGIKELIESITN